MTTKATDADRDQRLNEVLLAYVEAAQAGRAPDRSELLSAHPEFRADLEEFFASHDEVERLTKPLRSNAPPAVEVESELGQLGDFRLIRELGRGGMGVVYEAEQISLKRRVALKMLPFAAAIDPRQLQRFRNEALAAANLRHEHIVPVHAVGCDRGVHFYAMQYVEGQSLAGLIAELRGPGGESSAGGQTTGPYPVAAVADTRPEAAISAAASISRERSTGGRRYYCWAANLARQAALALEHAHQMGIVHRDIKPGNLLLDARGDLWVTDFGLAQFGADVGLTVTGEILGTLRYASPEQALARPGLVDHRSDVYSLGATLYELLTLRPIFDGRDRNTLLRQISNDEPEPPRALDRNIPAELETIVLKAVGKEPADRYATARDFADDLQRFLDDKPILAKRPSPLEKATKWARRHRGVVASALAALLLTVAGLAVATALTARAYDRERTKSEEADEQRARAEENYRQARRAVELFERIGEEELAGRPDPPTQALRRRLLETALTYYQGFIDQRGDDPSARAELEASRSRAIRILGELTTLMGAGQYRILHAPDVQKDLGLSEDQKKALARFDDHGPGGMGEINRVTPAEMERRVLARVQEQQAEVPKLLTPDQMRRFKQLTVRQRGPFAFAEADMAAALKLTPEQSAAIRTALDEVMPKFGGPPGGGGGPPRGPDDFGRKQEEARRRVTEEIVARLSPEQRRTWDELIGPPFHGKFQFGRMMAPWP